MLLLIGLVEKSISNATFIIDKYHVPVLIALFTSLYKVTLNTEMVINIEKISRFSRCALRPALGAILRDIRVKILGILQCRALCTTLLYVCHCCYLIILHLLESKLTKKRPIMGLKKDTLIVMLLGTMKHFLLYF